MAKVRKLKRRSRSGFKMTMGRFVFVLIVGSLAAAGALLYSGHHLLQREFPDVGILRTQFPVVHYYGPDEDLDVSIEKKRPPGWTPLESVSRVAVGAIIVSEDWAFYQHKGYDPNQIKEAIREDLERGHYARGASTITQQVVRNIFLEKEKNLWRKVKEIYLATQIEKALPKRRILELYLNIAEWGEGIFGIEAASKYYFNKSPRELTAKEGAFLAMLLPSPKRYSQSFRAHQLTEYARETVNSILDKMTQARYLSIDQRDQEKTIPLSFELPAPSSM